MNDKHGTNLLQFGFMAKPITATIIQNKGSRPKDHRFDKLAHHSSLIDLSWQKNNNQDCPTGLA